jgi:hypothetical protein
MRTLKYLLPLLIAPFCFAQGNPNCTLNFTLNAAGSSSNFANSTPACDKWTLTVYNIGFSGFSLTLQSAAAATTSTPSTFGTYGGTTATGSNPLTATGIATFTNGTVATPWLRVTLSGITGTGIVYGVLQGSQTVISKGGGSGGGALTIAGTASEIAVAGAGCTPTNSGTCTISIPSNAALPGAPTTTTATTADNSTKIATTAFVNAEITNAFTGCTFITGDLTCPGSITSGSGSGVAGTLDLTQGTLPGSFPANAFSLYAPTSIATSYQWLMPTADPGAGALVSDGGATPSNISVLPFQGNGGKIQKSTGSPVSGNCTKFDANANTVDAGAPCGSGGGGSAGASLFSTTGSTTVTATSPTTLIGTATGSTTIPVNTFTAGQVLEFIAQGYYTTPATPASLTITLNIGGTIRITTGAVVQIASVTTGVWRLRCAVTTRTAGASGTQIANCIFEETGATLTPGEAPMQTSSTWTIDTTATQVIDLVATWSTAVGAPTITSTNVAAWIPGAPVTSVGGLTGAIPGQGNGAKVQMSTGSTTTNDCVKFDANGNTVDAGAACGSGGGGGSASRGVFGSRPAAGTAGNTYYSTDIPVISQDNGSSWANWYNGQFVTLPSTLSFTARNSASFTTNGVSIVNPAATGSTLFGEDIPIPSTPYTLWVGLNCNQSNANAYCGMYVLNATGGTCVTYALLSGVAIQTAHFTSCLSGTLTGGTQDSTAPQSSIFQGKLNYFRLVDDGTNFKFYYCTDKIAAACLLSFTESRTANLSNPGFLGWFGSTNSGVPLSAITAFDFTVTQP